MEDLPAVCVITGRPSLDEDEHGDVRVSVQVTKWADFVPALNQQCIVLTPFCNETKWEEEVKRMSREEALNGGVEDATTSTR